MNVLLSIKPEFAKRIFEGQKKFEYRRAIFKRNDVKKIIVYASAPISKVIGEFEIEKIIYDELAVLWEMTSQYAGISEDYFFDYFGDKVSGYAIQIGKFVEYEVPLSLRENYGLTPPQSFSYIK